MRKVSLVAAAAAVAVVAGFREPEPSPLVAQAAPALPRLGIVHGSSRALLVRIDPRTLRVRPGPRLDVGLHMFGWSFTGDGARLALAGDLDSLAIPSVLVVDAKRLQAVGRVRLARSGWARATTWLPDGRLVAVTSVFEGGGVHTDVLTISPQGRQVLKRQTFSGQVIRVARTHDGLVVLLASTQSLEPARLLIVEPSGAADVVVVERIPAGSEHRRGEGAEFREQEPGLAVDPDHRRAFLVSANGNVAEVDLRTGAISYHQLIRPASLLSRLRAWFEPLAEAKRVEGPRRVARWLGGGLIAVSGGDYSVGGSEARPRLRFTPAGLELIDTRTWTVRRLGSGTDTFWPAGDQLLAGAATWSSELELPRPPGLVIYGAGGKERFQLYEGKRVWVVHADARRAYVSVSGRVEVVDLASGRVIERRTSIPYPVVWPGAAADS